MTDEQIIEIAEKEFRLKTLGITQSLLAIHKPVRVGGKLKIERIDREDSNSKVVAYIPVKGQTFYFAIYIDEVKRELFTVDVESQYEVYFRVRTGNYSLEDLTSMTKLKPTEGWSKGDILEKNGRPQKSRPFMDAVGTPLGVIIAS